MKTVIEMAREAGGMDGWGGRGKRSDPELKSDEFVFDPEDLERFAELVRADERAVLLELVYNYAEKLLWDDNFQAALRIDDLPDVMHPRMYSRGYREGQQAEREACAKVCDDASDKALALQSGRQDDLGSVILRHHAVAHQSDAAVIRARGNT